MAAKKATSTSSKSSSKGATKAATASSAGRVSVPGLGASKGMQGFLVLAEGDYKLECVGCKIKPSEKSPCDLWNFNFKVKTAGEYEGKRWSHRVTILSESHPSFNTIGIDELKSMCLAFGVAPKGDDISPESFIGLTANARIGQKMGDDGKGNERAENTVREWSAE